MIFDRPALRKMFLVRYAMLGCAAAVAGIMLLLDGRPYAAAGILIVGGLLIGRLGLGLVLAGCALISLVAAGILPELGEAYRGTLPEWVSAYWWLVLLMLLGGPVLALFSAAEKAGAGQAGRALTPAERIRRAEGRLPGEESAAPESKGRPGD